MIRASAPSKIMLFGEHALSYGEPAIATAIDKRVYATACELEEPRIIVEFKHSDDTIDAGLKSKSTNPIVMAVQNVLKRTETNMGIGVEIESKVPRGNGEDWRSAVASATGAAVMGLCNGGSVATGEIAEIANEAGENGMDSAVSAFGGTILFQRGKAHNIESKNDLSFVVGDTGSKSRGKELAEQIRQSIGDPRIALTVFSIGSLVRKAGDVLQGEKPDEIGLMMDKNHALLRDLGVSTPTLEKMVSAAKEAGAYGAKLTGGGGGGWVIALAKDPDNVMAALESAGAVNTFKIKANQEGARIEAK